MARTKASLLVIAFSFRDSVADSAGMCLCPALKSGVSVPSEFEKEAAKIVFASLRLVGAQSR
jgi:hypothetical protein